MSRKGRILITEDLPNWQAELSAILRDGGYEVEVAGTTAQALQLLEETFFHVLVLDIRMVDIDQQNVEGMTMLQILQERGLRSAVAVLMLSAYGTKAQMREAFREYDVTDFMDKHEFDDLEFLKQIQQTFARDVRINLDLTIHWQRTSGPEDAVSGLRLGGKRVKAEPQLHQRVAQELDDLLCRLFHTAVSIMAHPLASGKSGAGVLWVQPFYESGSGQARVVKFGDIAMLDQETRNFKTYVQPYIGGSRSTMLLETRRTPLLSGNVYSLLGADDKHLENFASFYSRADAAAIQPVLDGLFFDTCGNWYANHSRLQPLDLTEEYQKALGFTTDRLQEALAERLKTVQGKHELHFTALATNRGFRNPIEATAQQRFVRPTYTCITHGDFNQHNILVDNSGDTWLIDFYGTRPGYILRDVAQLDSVVRFELLGQEDATLDERLALEEALCSIERFSELPELASRFSTDNPALAKAYATVLHLRSLARKLVGQNTSDDLSDYYIALLYDALNTIRSYTLSKVQREHALLCASLLADRLNV